MPSIRSLPVLAEPFALAIAKMVTVVKGKHVHAKQLLLQQLGNLLLAPKFLRFRGLPTWRNLRFPDLPPLPPNAVNDGWSPPTVWDPTDTMLTCPICESTRKHGGVELRDASGFANWFCSICKNA